MNEYIRISNTPRGIPYTGSEVLDPCNKPTLNLAPRRILAF